MIDVSPLLAETALGPQASRGISSMAQRLVGSEILRIAGEVRALKAKGEKILDLTVGDFSPKEFPIPERLNSGIQRALNAGHTNYPPSAGMPECREAVAELFAERLQLKYPVSSVLIASGARPMIAGIYYALVNPGDKVVFGLPSWNNNHYCTMVGAQMVEVPTTEDTHFFPTAEALQPHLGDARLLCINTPANPTGTVLEAAALERISKLVVMENLRRQKLGAPPLYLMFDQVYWMLTFGQARHHTPVGLLPEMAPYTIFVDGISKGFAATGLRVGWAVGPTDVIERMSAILTHVGAWAPKPEQVATAELLRDRAAVDSFVTQTTHGLLVRLTSLQRGIEALKQQGWHFDVVAPEGAIYLSVKLDLRGRTAPGGQTLRSDEDVRKFLLQEARVALVPFTSFGLRHDTGWFRASVGAVSEADCASIGDRLGAAVSKLS